jgi:hypothetical protein
VIFGFDGDHLTNGALVGVVQSLSALEIEKRISFVVWGMRARPQPTVASVRFQGSRYEF